MNAQVRLGLTSCTYGEFNLFPNPLDEYLRACLVADTIPGFWDSIASNDNSRRFLASWSLLGEYFGIREWMNEEALSIQQTLRASYEQHCANTDDSLPSCFLPSWGLYSSGGGRQLIILYSKKFREVDFRLVDSGAQWHHRRSKFFPYVHSASSEYGLWPQHYFFIDTKWLLAFVFTQQHPKLFETLPHLRLF